MDLYYMWSIKTCNDISNKKAELQFRLSLELVIKHKCQTPWCQRFKQMFRTDVCIISVVFLM